MANRTDPDKHAEQMREGAKLRYAAKAELIRRHRAEYDEIYAELAQGSNITPQPDKFKGKVQ